MVLNPGSSSVEKLQRTAKAPDEQVARDAMGHGFSGAFADDAADRRGGRQVSAFADDTVGRLSALIGLAGDRAQHHYADFADEGGSVTVLAFRQKGSTGCQISAGRDLAAKLF